MRSSHKHQWQKSTLNQAKTCRACGVIQTPRHKEHKWTVPAGDARFRSCLICGTQQYQPAVAMQLARKAVLPSLPIKEDISTFSIRSGLGVEQLKECLKELAGAGEIKWQLVDNSPRWKPKILQVEKAEPLRILSA